MLEEIPKITIVTVVRNASETILDALQSVDSQSYPNIEHLVLDGKSTDGTYEKILEFGGRLVNSASEKDDGLYDAMNKGIRKASGEIIGFLHADDIFAGPDVIAHIGRAFTEKSIDASYGELLYVDQRNINKVTRYWKPGKYKRARFRRGWMPPHPTFYLTKKCYELYGGYRTDFGTSADYELLVRMLYKHNLNASYIPKVLVKMRVGGASNVSWANRLRANKADREAWGQNGLEPPIGLRYTKPFSKLVQYFMRPKDI